MLSFLYVLASRLDAFMNITLIMITMRVATLNVPQASRNKYTVGV